VALRRARLGWLSSLWESDRGLAALPLLLAAIVFAAPLVEPGSRARLVPDVAVSLLLAAGVVAVAQGRLSRAALGVAALATLVGHWAYVLGPDLRHTLLGALSALSFCVLLAFVVARRAFREGPVTVHRIAGAVAVYLLLGLTWTFAYETIAALDANAFVFSAPPATVAERSADLLYFSFVTLTTIGYGDVTAANPVARSLVVLEGLTGQLFPAVTLARLVALEVMTRR
jgi:hypothetical protein